MASVDLAGIAEPHRSAVTAIIDLARQGLFTDAQALVMIGRIRAVAGDLVVRVGTVTVARGRLADGGPEIPRPAPGRLTDFGSAREGRLVVRRREAVGGIQPEDGEQRGAVAGGGGRPRDHPGPTPPVRGAERCSARLACLVVPACGGAPVTSRRRVLSR